MAIVVGIALVPVGLVLVVAGVVARALLRDDEVDPYEDDDQDDWSGR